MNNILKFKCRFQLVVKNIDVRYHGEKWGNINYHTFFEKARKLCWYQCINTTENEYWNALKYSESIYWNIYISHDNSDIPDAIFKVQTYFHFLLIVRLFSQFIVTSFQIKKKKQTNIHSSIIWSKVTTSYILFFFLSTFQNSGIFSLQWRKINVKVATR